MARLYAAVVSRIDKPSKQARHAKRSTSVVSLRVCIRQAAGRGGGAPAGPVGYWANFLFLLFWAAGTLVWAAYAAWAVHRFVRDRHAWQVRELE